MQLNFKTFGEGHPLIILHGLFGTLDNWQTLAKQLSDSFMVYIIDQRNHGRSPHVDQIDYPSMANDLHEFMEANWIYEAHLLGHSMGGKTAMQFAVDFPAMVNKLVVVDIAPKAYEAGHDAIFQALMSIDLSAIENRSAAEEAFLQLIPDKGITQFLLKNLSRNKENGGYQWKMNLPVIYRDYPNIIAGLTSNDSFAGDTLFIRGGKSDYILDNDESNIKKYFPTAEIKTVEGAGHWVHAEAPGELLAMLRAFLG